MKTKGQIWKINYLPGTHEMWVRLRHDVTADAKQILVTALPAEAKQTLGVSQIEWLEQQEVSK